MPVLTTTQPPPLVRGSDLPYDDGIPMESSWHLDVMHLLMRILSYFWRERQDVYIGGNMFIYFDPDQVKTRNFRGPDFFVIKGVKSNHRRHSWVIWEEDGLSPDFVLELASASTIRFDLTGKKDIYQRALQTPEYVVYDPLTEQIYAWRLRHGRYEPIHPDDQGRYWCQTLDLWLGVVDHYADKGKPPLRALRFYDETGQLIPTKSEAEAQRADREAQRVEAVTQQMKIEAQRADREAQRAEAATQQVKIETQRADREAQRAEAVTQQVKIEAQRADREAQRAEAEAQRAEAAEAEIARLRKLLEQQQNRSD